MAESFRTSQNQGDVRYILLHSHRERSHASQYPFPCVATLAIETCGLSVREHTLCFIGRLCINIEFRIVKHLIFGALDDAMGVIL